MRKILNSLLVLSLLLVLNVKADMGPPALPQLEMEVSNSNGAKCYDFNWDNDDKKVYETGKVYQYGTKLFGSESSAINGNSKDYYILVEDEDYDDYNACFIKSSDLTLKQDSFDLSKAEKEKKELYVLVDSKIYSGPSTNFYKEVGSIPKEVKITSEYHVGDYWYYVEYNGVKGWICSDNDRIVSKITSMDENITYYPTPIFDFDGKTIGTIPTNTKVNIEWETDYSRKYYITYNGVTGFVSSFYNFAEDVEGKMTLHSVKKIDVYNHLGEGRARVGTLEANKEYDVKYHWITQGAAGYYIPSLKGWIEEGWIVEGEPEWYLVVTYDGEVDDHTKSDEDEKVIFDKLEVKGHYVEITKESLKDSTTVRTTIKLNEGETKLYFVVTPKEAKVEVIGNENLKDGSIVTVKVTDYVKTYTFEFHIETNKKVGDVEPPTPTPAPTPDKKGLTNEELIMICVGAGILIAVTILVIIKLVNKKKNDTSMSA